MGKTTTRAWNKDATENTAANGTTAGKYVGGVIKTADLQKYADFGVFAYQTGSADWKSSTYAPLFMYNQYIQAIWDGTTSFKSWDYSPVKYWPNGVDAANTANKPSNTATENGIQKLSFFAYAPYTVNLTTAYAAADDMYGIIPEGTNGTDEGKYFRTEAYGEITKGGVFGMSSNHEDNKFDPWVNFYLHNTKTDKAVDLLWGLRGQYKYEETDDNDNDISPDKLGAAYNVNLTKQHVNEKVRFLFKHALAKIGGSTKNPYSESGSWIGEPKQSGIQIVVDIDANSTDPNKGRDDQTTYFSSSFQNKLTLVTVKDVKIRDAKTYGEEGGGSLLTTAEKLSNLNTWGWFDIATGQWKNANSAYNGTDVSSATTAELNVTSNGSLDPSAGAGTAVSPGINVKIKEVGIGASGKAVPTEVSSVMQWNTENPVGVTTTRTPLYDNAVDYPGILLIPGENSQTLYVTVDYFVRTADKQLARKYSEVEQIITNKVDLSGLEANKYYTLVIHLGLTSVKFEAIVADWATTSDATYNEDGTINETATDDNLEGQSVWLPSNVVEAKTLTMSTERNTTKEVTIPAHSTTYTATITNLVATNSITVTKDGDNVTSTTPTLGTKTSLSSTSQDVTITLAPNNTGNLVTNTITATETDGSDNVISTTKIIIHQAPAVLAFDPATQNVGSAITAATAVLKNNGGTGATVDIADSPVYTLSAGVTAERNSGTKSQLDITFAKNTTALPITHTITLTQNNASATCEVVQAAGDIIIGMTQPSGWTWNAAAKTLALPNTAVALTNPTWTVTINDTNRMGSGIKVFSTNVTWLSINPETGALSATANTGAARTAKIFVTVDGVVEEIAVTQAAGA